MVADKYERLGRARQGRAAGADRRSDAAGGRLAGARLIITADKLGRAVANEHVPRWRTSTMVDNAHRCRRCLSCAAWRTAARGHQEGRAVRHRRNLAAIGCVLAVGAAAAIPSDAALKAKSYKNCTALHRDYPHGVGRFGAHDKTSGTPVTNFKRSNKIYAHNDGKAPHYAGEHDLDRDNDKIACEQR